jgi:Putative adhesin
LEKPANMKSLAAFFLALTGFSAFAQSMKSGDYNLDQEYKLDAKGTIYLNSSDAKVFITGSARPTAHVKIERQVTTKGWVFGEEEFRVDVTEQNGNLSIRERSNSSGVGIVGYHYEKYVITIEAPEGASLVIKGDDGDYFIKTVHGAVDLDLDDADVELTGCLGSDFKVRLDDGDLRMDAGKGILEVDADDADVIIKNASFEKIMANLDDGLFY